MHIIPNVYATFGHMHFQRKEGIMKRGLLYVLLFFLITGLLCCTQDKAEDKKILCRINEYNLLVEDFQLQLAEELELDSEFKLTNKAKQNFLEELIGKELLIQKATKLKLDRKEKFVRAIERYWESTLIRDLMELKCEEISKRISVSEEEIDSRYKEMIKLGDPLPPLAEIRDQIRVGIKDEKKTRALEQWTNDLRSDAIVEIKQDLL